MKIEPFLTAYDPSDLPGGSIDPLGFERGYLFLADKILPGMTNVAARPRYYSILCSGTHLSGADGESAPREQYRRRLDCVLRFERLWALANVLARGDEELPTNGLRGVSYAESQAERLSKTGAAYTDGEFNLLSRQVQYGAVGIYGALVDKMMLWERRSLTLTPDSGKRLAEGFLKETSAPKELKAAAVEKGKKVRLEALSDWGRRSHLSGGYCESEARCLADAVLRDRVRPRMLALLKKHPWLEEEDEMQRLRRITKTLQESGDEPDIRESCEVILAYEDAYRLVMLGFERILHLCRNSPSGIADDAWIGGDSVLERVCEETPGAVGVLIDSLERGRSDGFRDGLERLRDVRQFLELASASSLEPAKLVKVLVARHRDVQHGKFDRGRRKMPWVEERPGGLSLTMTRVGGMDKEPEQPDQIPAHPYRLAAADEMNVAIGGS